MTSRSARRKFKLSAAASVAAVTSVPSASQAFDRRDVPSGISCTGQPLKQTLSWKFVNGAGVWNADEKVLFRDAIVRWNLMKTSAGNPLLNSNETSSGDVQVIRNLSDGTSSNTACVADPGGGTHIEIRIHSPVATLASPGSLPGSSNHESGHAHMLDHTGNGESHMFGGNYYANRGSRMRGCNAAFGESGYPESDDWSQAVAKSNAANLPQGVYSPDGGFEAYADAVVLGSADVRSGPMQVWQGVKAALFQNGSGNPTGDDWVAVASGGLQQVTRMTNPSTNYGLSSRYKMSASSVGASFKFEYRRILYSSPEPGCGNAWPSTLNVNSPSFVDGTGTWIVATNQTRSGTTSWANTPLWTTAAAPGYPFGNGLDVRISAANTNPSAGDLYIDNFFGYML